MGRAVWVSSHFFCAGDNVTLTRKSPVFSLQLGTKTMIVLSSDVAVKDVLDKRSSNYSDRPDMFIGQEVASGGMRLVVMVSNVPLTTRISACPNCVLSHVYSVLALRRHMLTSIM